MAIPQPPYTDNPDLDAWTKTVTDEITYLTTNAVAGRVTSLPATAQDGAMVMLSQVDGSNAVGLYIYVRSASTPWQRVSALTF